MSENPEVKLPIACDRMGKTVEIKIPLQEVEAFLADKRSRTENAEAVENFFSKLSGSPGELPDLVAYYKGRLVVLPTVLPKNDTVVLRLLNEATQSDAFPKPEPKLRKAKKRKDSGKSDSELTLAETSK